MKNLLMAVGVAVTMWGGIIGTGKWMFDQIQPGIDQQQTASTR
ncbi:hypothetical protein [Rhizobium sp. CCGE531]|nr:hypothetical protein [Rhizobium sp. CCGE531]